LSTDDSYSGILSTDILPTESLSTDIWYKLIVTDNNPLKAKVGWQV
jgi:hypothetical protein